MTQVSAGWGAGPTARYDELIAPLRPILQWVRERAVQREREHVLLHAEIQALREAGFPRWRLPVEAGGFGATLPELFAALSEIGAAEPSLVNALRSHLGFCEEVISSPDSGWRQHWLARLGAGDISGSGFSEVGGNALASPSTRLTREAGRWRLDGAKYYTSGSLYADWINLSAADPEGRTVGVLVPTRAPGVAIDDDWDGFGQQLSASGTARFDNVTIADALIKPTAQRFRYAAGFFQLVHIATLAGIGRAAAAEVAQLVAERTRVYGGRTLVNRVSEDPQILEVVGRVHSLAYVAGAAAGLAAQALQRAADQRGNPDEAAREQSYALADIEVSQTVTVVTDLILDATTRLFDALGSSAAKRGLGLDRHWRNARTIASHNPRVYHDRVIGDWRVNGKAPPPKTGVGIAPAATA
ncbi:MAG: Dibenzothiophene desulfurization enzyme C [Paracidovorax wautersii]|uniref:Dibenzothiophene desulfurization enzyme C n=1 Tax=Paracidovorax wautersii TaxID=1177982 RepID=A0A7V8JQ85_9BURK|nr:MAG: Dibenzothiophene desulfurization enzyme C [Paracidovorax wautersii]